MILSSCAAVRCFRKTDAGSSPSLLDEIFALLDLEAVGYST